MKRIWILTTLAAVIFALYVGMATRTAHPMDELFDSMVDKMNEARVVKFKSGFAINVYHPDKPEDNEQWQFKREGTYDAWSKFLHFKNLTHFENLATNEDEEVEEKTSLSIEERGNMVALPLKEAYFKNRLYFGKKRASGSWEYQEKHSYGLLELLPLNSEVLNRYAKFYKSENRGRFVVYFFSVDPNYLTRTFPNILESDDHTFPIRFKEGTIKTLVYPDTNLPRRVYAIYVMENLETGEIYEYNIDTYFSEDETYKKLDEPGIPWNIMRYRELS